MLYDANGKPIKSTEEEDWNSNLPEGTIRQLIIDNALKKPDYFKATLVYFSGTNGAGKTTQSKLTVKYFSEKGIIAHHIRGLYDSYSDFRDRLRKWGDYIIDDGPEFTNHFPYLFAYAIRLGRIETLEQILNHEDATKKAVFIYDRNYMDDHVEIGVLTRFPVKLIFQFLNKTYLLPNLHFVISGEVNNLMERIQQRPPKPHEVKSQVQYDLPLTRTFFLDSCREYDLAVKDAIQREIPLDSLLLGPKLKELNSLF